MSGNHNNGFFFIIITIGINRKYKNHHSFYTILVHSSNIRCCKYLMIQPSTGPSELNSLLHCPKLCFEICQNDNSFHVKQTLVLVFFCTVFPKSISEKKESLSSLKKGWFLFDSYRCSCIIDENSTIFFPD